MSLEHFNTTVWNHMGRRYARIFDQEHNLFQEANIFLEVNLKLCTSKTKCESKEMLDYKESIVKD